MSAQTRQAKAEQIDLSAIQRDGDSYLVPSSEGKKKYRVTANSCGCADFQKRGVRCYHQLAVERLCPPSKFVGDPFNF
jgi:SWIM zinc finger